MSFPGVLLQDEILGKNHNDIIFKQVINLQKKLDSEPNCKEWGFVYSF